MFVILPNIIYWLITEHEKSIYQTDTFKYGNAGDGIVRMCVVYQG